MHDATRASANVALNVKFMSSTRDQVHNRTGKALETDTSRVPDDRWVASDETSAPAAWFREMSHTMTRIVGLTGSVTTHWDMYSTAICCEIRKVRRTSAERCVHVAKGFHYLSKRYRVTQVK